MLVKHTATLFWLDQKGDQHKERHVGWNARRATTDAYKRAKSMMLHGEAKCFRITHHEKVIAA